MQDILQSSLAASQGTEEEVQPAIASDINKTTSGSERNHTANEARVFVSILGLNCLQAKDIEASDAAVLVLTFPGLLSTRSISLMWNIH